jgi:hypothetical protein
MEFVDHHLAIEVVEVDQEFVGMFRRDFEWVKRFFGEVFQVVCHDHLSLPKFHRLLIELLRCSAVLKSYG